MHGEIQRSIYIVLNGSFSASMVLDDGSVKAVWFYLDSFFHTIMSYDSTFLNIPTNYQIKALEQSTVLKIRFKSFERLVQDHPKILKIKTQNVLDDFFLMNEIKNRISSFSSIEFIGYLTRFYPNLIDRVPAKILADLMGISPEWFCKLKKRLGPIPREFNRDLHPSLSHY